MSTRLVSYMCMVTYRCMTTRAFGLLVASAILVVIDCGAIAVGLDTTVGLTVRVAVLVVNAGVTLSAPRVKAAVVRCVQRWLINPPVRLLLHLGVMPLGYALLETRGHRTGRRRRTPVGNGRMSDGFWIVAEHGLRSGYVANIRRDPHVRVRLRVGWRFRWVSGVASIHPEIDPVSLQRRLSAWHPLRAFNAVQVQVLGSDLLVVRIALVAAPGGSSCASRANCAEPDDDRPPVAVAIGVRSDDGRHVPPQQSWARRPGRR